MRRCVVCRALPSDTLRLFSFPQNQERRLLWHKAMFGDVEVDYNWDSPRICSKHFEDSAFRNSTKQKLNLTAIPTLFSACAEEDNDDSQYVETVEVESISKSEDNMNQNLCVVCRLPKQKGENATIILHSFPKDRRLQWHQAMFGDVPCTYNMNTRRICGRHFEDSQFRNSTKRSLNYNAMPTLFPKWEADKLKEDNNATKKSDEFVVITDVTMDDNIEFNVHEGHRAVLDAEEAGGSNEHELIIKPTEKSSPSKLCGICCRKLNPGKCVPMTVLISQKPAVKAYEMIELISPFRYTNQSPQFLCSKCVVETIRIHEFQQMCNNAFLQQENIIEVTEVGETGDIVVPLDMFDDMESPEGIEPYTEDITFTMESGDDSSDECESIQVQTTEPQMKILNKAHSVKPATKMMQMKPAKRKLDNQHRLFTCRHCHTQFPKKFLLERHVRIVHKEANVPKSVKAYQCKHCPNSYDVEEGLLMHMVVHV